MKTKVRKIIAAFLAINILFEAIAPTCAYALTGGPSQPEVQSFEPVGTSDMVDIFSGDFNYNIPLMDVDGYPINIAYHSGITMDQEASWVGLGWNINPGVINRGMRGIPDDFNGENIVKELNVKPNKTYGFNTGAGIELFGLSKLKLGVNYSIGVKYNNYNGIGVDQSLNLSLSSGDAGKSPLCGSLGLNSSSDEGLSVQPSVSFSAKAGKTQKTETSLTASLGTAFNSRGGLKALTIGVSGSVSSSAKGKKLDYGGREGTGSTSAGSVSSSFDFGMPTYTPQAGLPMQNLSITGNFKLGFEGYGLHPNFTIGGFYSSQKLSTNSVSNPAYGYMNADEGTKYDNALLDFNREEKSSSSFTPSTPALPVTNFTYDIYSVSGQGVGGSYRPFRSDLGHVFDPRTNTTSDGYSIGAEVGLGNTFHVGVDFTVNNVDGTSGRWSNGNPAAAHLTHRASTGDPFYEKYYFKEANEKSVDADPSFYSNAGGAGAKSVLLNQLSKYNTIADRYYTGGGPIPSDNYRKKRERRTQPLTIITKGELNNYGLEVRPNLYNAPNHHIAEITTLKNDGTRYVYGIAAYNKRQEETTFAVGKKMDASGGRSFDVTTGIVNYVAGTDNSIGNGLGIDNYFSNTIMPAYAHSYMLTAMLSPDYVDSENYDARTRGPSDGDIGNYTKFNYEKIEDYNWRVPVGVNQATYNEGLKSDPTDDKANYLYGVKDLYYLKTVETKNYIAVFTLDDRKDSYGVVDKNGERSASKPMKLLKKISLYIKREYNASPSTAIAIKEVNFEYDYSLCPNVPNNINDRTANDNGKLTLKRIYFTYQKSNKARLSPYEFKYSVSNPPYNIKGYDRWGNYKPVMVNGVLTAEYPYVEQDKTSADQYAQAWSLTEIYLPSGGRIKVDYESDDYAYVQHKQAGQMFKIVDITTDTGTPVENSVGTSKSFEASFTQNRYRMFFKLQRDINNNLISDINKYLEGIDNLYFRVLMDIRGGKKEYVSGYAQIDKGASGVSGNLGWVTLRSVNLKDDNTGHDVNPIVKAAIQFGRLNTPRMVWSSVDVDNTMSSGSFGKDLLVALINSDFTKNIGDAIAGPNQALYSKYNVGKSAIMGQSWLRLNNPNKRKLGGGCRVKRIAISDEWTGSGIAENPAQAYSYGQEYTYTMQDGTSSGIAAYEPQLGGDENPWKQPVFFDFKKLLAPDDEHYMEEPFGESFFPSPNVGYSRVTVKNIQRDNVKHNDTVKVVNEFYTAKDFPTIAERTDLTTKREKTNPLSLSSLFKLKVKDYMTASQGYVVELNDMHGKPKKQEVYQEGQTTPITSIEYRYKSSSYLNNSFRLNNGCTVLYSNGSVSNNTDLGVFFDFVSDMRESTNETTSAAFNFNVDGFIIPPIPAPIPVPIGLPSFTNEKTRFRSAVITKVIQRFGVLEETIAKDLGSTVSTKNLAYDAETGDVLLTETTTNFNDKVYALTYPAYWYYNGMGPAYQNIGFSKTGITFSNGSANVPNALTYFAEGDEIALSGGIKAWVIAVTPQSVQAVNRAGNPVSGTFEKVLGSGKRNQQGVPMANITSLSNPLTSIESNTYNNVLQAQAMEFTNSWRTFCNCFDNVNYTTNPYILGTKGMYKNKKSYLYLAGRTQSNYNNNTNIRKDGVFTAYTPFYKLNARKWEIDSRNWTFTSEVTEFSPFGAELENKDALGRYSSATYGYNQTLPTAVIANSKYKNIGFDNFEDYDFNECADNHFKFRNHNNNVNAFESHTGNKSIMVTSGAPVNMTKQLLKCDAVTCSLGLISTGTGGAAKACYIVTGGAPPYRFDWTTPGCDMIISINDAGDGICINRSAATNSCIIILSATDKNNCRQVFQINLQTAAN
ncbi:MAG: hypothetical protein ACT4ON_15820 [Bacteroidota bacterium]